MDMNEIIKNFIELDKRYKSLDVEMKAIAKEKTSIEEVILNHMTETGMESVRINGSTVFSHHQVWAKKLTDNQEEINRALSAAGHDDIIETKPNSNRLSALIREYVDGDRPLPESFENVLGSNTVYSVRVRH